MGLHTNSLLLTLPTNIKQEWKEIAAANTLAYCDTAIITDVESFIVKAPEADLINILSP